MRVEISSLVREAGATTVYITHDQSEAFALADMVGVLEEGRLVQYGTPEQVYHHPATPFVARFTGLAGELRVKVASRGSDGTVEVTAMAEGGHSFPALRPADVRAGADAGDQAAGAAAPSVAPDTGGMSVTMHPGDEAVLAIRPTGVQLASLTDGSPHLTGRVADVAFRGRGYDYAIDLPGLGQLTGIYASHRAARGEQVGLRLEPDGCHLFPADAREGDEGNSRAGSPDPALTA
jgi:ABC-type Fe3+/spermidine/putrescine transport system ATPase subunit